MPEWLSGLHRDPVGLAACAIMLLVAAVAAFGPMLAPYPPELFHVTQRLQGPSAQFWFGTDQFGRDVFSRVLAGGRSAILFGLIATGIAVLAGGAIGAISGYIGGWLDGLLMRFLDVLLAIPGLLLTLLILAALGSGTGRAILAVAIGFAPGFGRLARGVTLSLRARDFVVAAIARGDSTSYIIGREILPNLLPPLIVEGSIRVAMAIMIGATLSYLGLGAQAPASDWGLMVAEAREYFLRYSGLLVFPAAAIAISALGFNLLGDWLRDRLNPEIAR